MRRFIYIGITLTASLLTAAAAAAQPVKQQLLTTQRTTVSQTEVCGLPVKDVKVQRTAAEMSVSMVMQLGDYRLTGDRVSVFAPVLVNGKDSLAFDPVGLYSRIRYIQYMRHGNYAAGGETETSFKYAERPAAIAYSQTVPYEEWMNGATLYMRRCDYGCCNTLVDEVYTPMAGWREAGYTPVYHYVTPEAEGVKMRELAGRAYIDFQVNMTELDPDYRKNPAELAKITATIDSVRNDKDVTVKRITIKGWASPEGPWDNNVHLAKGRTATLKQYVQYLYRFPEGFIETDYCPEDWAGLRDFVETSNLPHRAEILALIDNESLEPDPKEWVLKSRYPDEYKFLLATVYPGLRHSDYTIEYTIRHYSDPTEIRRVMAEAPQKLSLDEFFILAKTLEPGSDEYNEVFETAVRLYPNDPTANLNAASSAMQRNDLANAERYLAKAGESDAAVYARGVYAALNGDLRRAVELYGSVAGRMPEAAEALKMISELTESPVI